MTKKDTSQVKVDKSIMPTLKNMELFESETFPISKMTTVKTTSTTVSIMTGMKFRTKQINDMRLIQVTRIA